MKTFSHRARAYPPDFVDADELAYRLSCSKSTISSYVARGLLPKPTRIGDLVRWRWATVEKFIVALETGAEHADAHNDPYLAGIDRGTTAEANC
jgi:predicted DNA-binding transcriptional regulator AlpA